MVNVLKFLITFLLLLSNKFFIFRAGIHKIVVERANREDHDQTAYLGLCCLPRL